MAFRYVGMVPTELVDNSRLVRLTTKVFGTDLIHGTNVAYEIKTTVRKYPEFKSAQDPLNGLFQVTETYGDKFETVIDIVEGRDFPLISLLGGLKAHTYVVGALFRGADIDVEQVHKFLKMKDRKERD